jgi:cell wall-associated NlpC family hydrolase
MARSRRHRKSRAVRPSGTAVRAGLVVAVIAAACAGTRMPTASVAQAAEPVSVRADAAQLAEPASRWLTRSPLGINAKAPAAVGSEVRTQPEASALEAAALRRAKRYMGTRGPWSHLCLRFVRKVYDLPARDRSAITAWRAAESKHKGDAVPPAGVPVFWSGGGPGHVALSLGDGWVLTSDYPSSGRVTRVPISAINSAWHLRYLGWTDDLEGVIVHR